VQQHNLITTQAPMINSQGQIVNPIQVFILSSIKMFCFLIIKIALQHYQVYNPGGMHQGLWSTGNLQQNTVLQSGPVYIRSMQADGTSLFIPQNSAPQAMQQQQHNCKLVYGKGRNRFL